VNVKIRDLFNVYQLALEVKKSSFYSINIDFLWFCDDIMDNSKDVIQPIMEQIDTLKKWYSDTLTEIQTKYSKKDEFGNVSTIADDNGNNIMQFENDDNRLKYAEEYKSLTNTFAAKDSELGTKLDVYIDLDALYKIKRDILPKLDINPMIFESLKKFVER